MNHGKYYVDDIKMAPTDFYIGAAGYPEKHFEANEPQNRFNSFKRES